MIIPTTPLRPLIWDERIDRLKGLFGPGDEVYIVGGAVRDAYLRRPIHDIDLATPGDGRPLARLIANRLSGAYYVLDAERGVGRALVPWGHERITIDVAQFRGPDLVSDLKKRDFTLNAMAVRLDGDLQAVLDPLSGLADLEAGRLRQCSDESIAEDPVRALRGVRASIAFRLLIETSTQKSIKASASALTTVSPERVRDELFQILDTPSPSTSLRIMRQLDLLAPIVPEMATMTEVPQSPPHQFNLWEHTLHSIASLDALLSVITPGRKGEQTSNVKTGAVASVLDVFRHPLREHLSTIWPNERTHRALLIFSALLHDSGKPETQSMDSDGHIHFYDHETAGVRLAAARARHLCLSNEEIARITTIIRNHMRPHWLCTEEVVSRRATYRFWRDTGAAGVDVCLLAMADYLATYGVTLKAHDWAKYLENVRALLTYYFDHAGKGVSPSPLVTGQDILEHFLLRPGPLIGTLLEHVREAQAVGELSTKEEALQWVQQILDSMGSNEHPGV